MMLTPCRYWTFNRTVLIILNQLNQDEETTKTIKWAPKVVLPAAYFVVGSRKDVSTQVERMFALYEQRNALPLWEILHTQDDEVEKQLIQWKLSLRDKLRYGMVIGQMPALNNACQLAKVTEAFNEATGVVLALEVYHRQSGQYPAALTDLVPHYLPQAPVDHCAGLPLLYKLKDGKPLLYGRGKEGVDHGGVWTYKTTYWPNLPNKGDWILYPPVEEK